MNFNPAVSHQFCNAPVGCCLGKVENFHNCQIYSFFEAIPLQRSILIILLFVHPTIPSLSTVPRHPTSVFRLPSSVIRPPSSNHPSRQGTHPTIPFAKRIILFIQPSILRLHPFAKRIHSNHLYPVKLTKSQRSLPRLPS